MTIIQYLLDTSRILPTSRMKPRMGRLSAAGLTVVGANPEVNVGIEGGGAVLVDARDRSTGDLAWNGSRENFSCMLVRLCLEFGPCFYDIGANVGLISVPVGLALPAENRRIVSFEPVPRNMIRLRKNLEMNHLDGDSTLIETALGDSSGIIVLHVESTLGSDSGNAFRNARSSRRLRTVPVQVNLAELDELAESLHLPVPDVVKIDTEGQDMAVLRGARRVLDAARPIIFAEFNTALMDELGETTLSLGNALPRDYVAFSFLSLKSIRKISISHGIGDILLVPSEKVSRLPLEIRD